MKKKPVEKSFFPEKILGLELNRRILLSTLLCVISYYFYNEFLVDEPSPVISTKFGQLQGTVGVSRQGRRHFKFLGIPYAAPPVGDLRFEPPEPPIQWKNVRRVNKFQPECAQMEIMATGRILGSEDCLYLNVFTPKLSTSKPSPVMVFIYGGLFMAGAADLYNGDYFMDEDVVLVTVSYRVAALGFLNTGDGIVRGNMGLKDQLMALKWVQGNILGFGGDPNRVTIFGESAGGASVHYHMLSKQSEGLFHKAISQSGLATFKWVLNPKPLMQAQKLGAFFGCPTNNSRDMVSCLKMVPTKDLVRFHRPIMNPIHETEDAFLPTVESVVKEDTFLSSNPLGLIKKGNFSAVPWMTGITSHEGLYLIARLLLNETITNTIGPRWKELVPGLLNYERDGSDYAANKIQERFFGVQKIVPQQMMAGFARLFTEYWFFADFAWTIEQHLKRAPVYLYHFSYRSRKSLFPLFQLASQDDYLAAEVKMAALLTKDWINKYVFQTPTPVEGTCHADDLPLLFNFHPLVYIKQNSEHYEMSKEMVKSWVAFASDKSPLEFNGVKWPLVAPGDRDLKFMDLNIPGGVIDNPVKGVFEFWDKLKLKSVLVNDNARRV